MRIGVTALLVSALLAAAPANAATIVNFTFNSTQRNAPPLLATGSFSYTDGLSGLLEYDDLLSFDISIFPNTMQPALVYNYNLASISSFNQYRYFGYDATANAFVAAMLTGPAGDFTSVLSAETVGRTSGFFFSPIIQINTTTSYGIGKEWRSDLGRKYTSVTLNRTVGAGGGPIIIIPDPTPGGEGGGSTVPEPAAWAMLIAGFGLTGAAMRRRRTVSVTA